MLPLVVYTDDERTVLGFVDIKTEGGVSVADIKQVETLVYGALYSKFHGSSYQFKVSPDQTEVVLSYLS